MHLFRGVFIYGLIAFSTAFTQITLSPQLIWYNQANSPLPSDQVYYVYPDKSGKYWFACGDFDTLSGGLVRFDGQEWYVFQPDNSGLPVSKVTHVDQDARGDLWVATRGGGIARFDGNQWEVFHTGNSPLASNDVWTLTIDPDGSIWIGTWADGLNRFDGQNWQWFHPNNSPLGSAKINFIQIDSDGMKWIGSDYYGLQSFDGQTWKSHGQGRLLPGIHTTIVDMVIDKEGVRWIAGVEGGVGGVIVRYQDTVWKEIESLSGSFDFMVSYKGMAIDTAGHPWMATRSGLIHFYSDTLWKRITLDTLAGFPIETFWSLNIDRLNNKWISIAYWDSTHLTFRGAGVLVYNEDGVLLTGLSRQEPVPPKTVQLKPAYPNPFNATTTITVQFNRQQLVQLAVYNIRCQRVRLLYQGVLKTGTYRFLLDGKNLASGVYLVTLKYAGNIQVQKVVLIK